jgi:hypothetical protein
VDDCIFVDDTPMLLDLKQRLNMDFIAANWAKSAKPLWKHVHDEIVLDSPQQLWDYVFFSE